MDFIYDKDIVGEILMPLDFHIQQNFDISSVLEYQFTNFRSILFQGEILKFYVAIRSESMENIMDHLFFKLEFDQCCDSTDELSKSVRKDDIDSAMLLMDDTSRTTSEIPISRNRQSFLDIMQHDKFRNLDHDHVIRKHLIPDKNIAIFELMKQVMIPNYFLNKNTVVKLNIMRKNYIDEKKETLSEIFENSCFQYNEAFSTIKTLFKEVRVIRPVSISNVRQTNCLPDTVILQFKIQNITSSINFIDNSLKLSKFLASREENHQRSLVSFGMPLNIKDCQILKEETKIDRKTIISTKNQHQVISKDEIPLDNLHFSLLNSAFPLEILPGEEFNFCIKINKSNMTYEKLMLSDQAMSTENNYNIETNNNVFTSTIYNSSLLKPNSSSTKKGILNSSAKSNTQVSNFDTASVRSGKSLKSLKTNENISFPRPSTIINQIEKNIIQNNFSKSKTILETRPSSIHINKIKDNNDDNTDTQNSPKSHKSGKLQFKELKEESNNQSFEEQENQESEDIIKVMLSTPVLLNITAEKFYDSLYMSIPIKWENEITRFMKVDINLKDDCVLIHQYFKLEIRLKNLTSCKMDIEIEINDICKTCTQPYNLPCILSETKQRNIGEIQPNQEQTFEMRFLALKEGFNNLSEFILFDRISNRRFYTHNPNRIYVNIKNLK